MKKDQLTNKKAPPGKNISKDKQGFSKKETVIPRVSHKANRYFVLSFFLFAFILYGNTIFNKYAVDDNLVTNNPVVQQGFKAIPGIFSSRYFLQQGNLGSSTADYRPIVKASFAVEYQLWGDKPGRSHAINILLYWALSVLLFFILKRLLLNYNILFPFLITLLFMAHPVHTEVVASLKNRDELLAFICGLGSLWFLLDYAENRKISYVFLSIVIFFIGYLCKSSILPFLFLIPLVLHFFTRLQLKTIVPVFLAIFAVVLLAQMGPRLFLPAMQRTNSFIENPLYFEKSIWIRLGTGLVSLLFYLRTLIYPYPLLYYYGYNMIPVTNLANIWALLSLVIHAGLFLYALMKFREKHFLSFAILWYLVAIAMYSNVVFPVVGIVGERFVFNASLGFCLVLVFFIFKIFRTEPKSLTIEMDSRLKILAVVILLLIPYTVLSVTRNRDWRNLFDLYRHDVKSLNNSAKANIDYGGFLMGTVYQDQNFLRTGTVNQFKYQIIVSHFRRALTLYPDNYLTTNDLGTVYLFMGKNYDSAVYFLRKAIALDSTLQPAWVNLGMAYREQKQYQRAIGCYEHILKVNPNQVKATFALANVYNDMGEFDRAVKMNEDVMKSYPNLEMPYVNIGNYYMLKKDTATAVNYWEKAAAINPSFELCVQLNTLYLIKGDHEKADYYYRIGEEIAKQSQR
ncbi:MAG: tetratricopeptide repeat protein [Bacteroidetes bacterium]|nr:tetratricopeptide repeat protein [Bacteroidota bacterium]